MVLIELMNNSKILKLLITPRILERNTGSCRGDVKRKATKMYYYRYNTWITAKLRMPDTQTKSVLVLSITKGCLKQKKNKINWLDMNLVSFMLKYNVYICLY